MKKPCIQCGNECEILPVQLGDLFTLTFLRVCGPECMFLEAYDYLREQCNHKGFRNWLYDKQNEEDAAERKAYVDGITEEALRMMREDLKANPKMLSTPMPEGMLKIFEDVKPIPQCSSSTVRFTRPSKDERIKWAKQHVERMQEGLRDAIKDLESLENGV